MKRIPIILATLAAFATLAFAQNLPQNAFVTVKNASGTAVGLGSIEHGQLSLELNAAATGLAGSTLTIAITGPSGTQTLPATIDASGTITVTAGGTSQDLASYARAAGLSGVEVSVSPDASSGSSNDQASGSGQAETPDSAAAASKGDTSADTSGSADQSHGSDKTSGSSQAGKDNAGADSGTHTSGQSADDGVAVGTNLGSSKSGGEGN